MDKQIQRKWANLRQDAYEKAKLQGIGAKEIAEKVGTSPTNVINLIGRGSHTSQYSGKIDAYLRETVAEYNGQLNDLFESNPQGDAPTEIGNLLMSQARLLRDPQQSIEFKLDTIDTIIEQLQSFKRNYDRLAGENENKKGDLE